MRRYFPVHPGEGALLAACPNRDAGRGWAKVANSQAVLAHQRMRTQSWNRITVTDEISTAHER
jgi:hypothetical protein